MNVEEFISLTRELVSIHPGRYEEILVSLVDEVKRNGILKELEKDVNLKIISSTRAYSEVVDLDSITIIWDRYQWELVDKAFLSGILFINHHEDVAVRVFKSSMYGVLSGRLENLCPELSYVFTEKYRDYLQQLNYQNIALVSSTFSDLLYCQIIALGHEISHILFNYSSIGKILYNVIQDDFLSIMKGAKKTGALHDDNLGLSTAKELFNKIMDDSDNRYREELICDIFSYIIFMDFIIEFDKKKDESRRTEELYDDLFSTFDILLKVLNSYNYIFQFWTDISVRATVNRIILPDDISRNNPVIRGWRENYLARENLVSLYMRVKLFRDKKIYVKSENRKVIMIYNSIIGILRKLLTFEDEEWPEIFVEANSLLSQNLNKDDILDARNSILNETIIKGKPN